MYNIAKKNNEKENMKVIVHDRRFQLSSDVVIPTLLKVDYEIETYLTEVDDTTIYIVIDFFKTLDSHYVKVIALFSHQLVCKIRFYYRIVENVFKDQTELLESIKFHPLLAIKMVQNGIISHDKVKVKKKLKNIYSFMHDLLMRSLYFIPRPIKVFFSDRNLSENEFKLGREIFEFGYPKDFVGYFVKVDDILSLKRFIENSASKSSAINMKIYCLEAEGFGKQRSDDYSLVSLAAFFGSKQCFYYLMSNNAFTDDCVLKLAVSGGCVEIVKHLMGLRKVTSNYPLQAISNHNNELLDLILHDKGFNLLDCIKAFNIRQFVFCLSNGGDVNFQTDKKVKSPLHVACKMSLYNLCQILIDNGAKVNMQCSKNQNHREFPLHIALEMKSLPITKLLIENGANVNTSMIKMERRITPNETYEVVCEMYPIHIACSSGNLDLVKLLVDNKCNMKKMMSTTGSDGYTSKLNPLHIAMIHNWSDIAKYLIHKGIDVDECIKDERHKNRAPLHIAVRSNNIALVDKLLKHNASVNKRDSHKDTILITACKNNFVEIAEKLVKHGGNPHLKNKRGLNCFDIAENLHLHDIKKLLLNH